MTDETRVPLNRIERILATMIATVGGLSVIAIVGVFLGRSAGADLADFHFDLTGCVPVAGKFFSQPGDGDFLAAKLCKGNICDAVVFGHINDPLYDLFCHLTQRPAGIKQASRTNDAFWLW